LGIGEDVEEELMLGSAESLNDFFWRTCSFLTEDVEDVEDSFGGRISGVDYMAGRTVIWKEVRKCLGDIE
jgi:hypothetical protein